LSSAVRSTGNPAANHSESEGYAAVGISSLWGSRAAIAAFFVPSEDLAIHTCCLIARRSSRASFLSSDSTSGLRRPVQSDRMRSQSSSILLSVAVGTGSSVSKFGDQFRYPKYPSQYRETLDRRGWSSREKISSFTPNQVKSSYSIALDNSTAYR
jgi:hypothetical protein